MALVLLYLCCPCLHSLLTELCLWLFPLSSAYRDVGGTCYCQPMALPALLSYPQVQVCPAGDTPLVLGSPLAPGSWSPSGAALLLLFLDRDILVTTWPVQLSLIQRQTYRSSVPFHSSSWRQDGIGVGTSTSTRCWHGKNWFDPYLWCVSKCLLWDWSLLW